MPAPRSRLSRLWVDVSPLREFPAYRRLWVGDLVASAGSQFAAVAFPYQVYRQTGSSLQVGWPRFWPSLRASSRRCETP